MVRSFGPAFVAPKKWAIKHEPQIKSYREMLDQVLDLFQIEPDIDALFIMLAETASSSLYGALAALPCDRRLLLVTAHRRESCGRPIEEICEAQRRIASERGDEVHFVYPVHRNPQVWEPVHDRLAGEPGITLLPPVDYRTLISLMARCYLVLTDSGGIQKEAPSLDKPVLVLREKTERPEAEAAGATLVIGTECQRIVSETYRLLDDSAAYACMASTPNPYGDGHAAERIADALIESA